jgi:hypothetical protein
MEARMEDSDNAAQLMLHYLFFHVIEENNDKYRNIYHKLSV